MVPSTEITYREPGLPGSHRGRAPVCLGVIEYLNHTSTQANGHPHGYLPGQLRVRPPAIP